MVTEEVVVDSSTYSVCKYDLRISLCLFFPNLCLFFRIYTDTDTPTKYTQSHCGRERVQTSKPHPRESLTPRTILTSAENNSKELNEATTC